MLLLVLCPSVGQMEHKANSHMLCPKETTLQGKHMTPWDDLHSMTSIPSASVLVITPLTISENL